MQNNRRSCSCTWQKKKKKKRKVESLFFFTTLPPPAAVFGNLLFIPAWLLPNAAEASPHCLRVCGLVVPSFWPVRLPPCSCAGSLRRALMRQPFCVVAPVDKLSYRLTAFTVASFAACTLAFVRARAPGVRLSCVRLEPAEASLWCRTPH